MSATPERQLIERLLPVLVRIQAHLDEELPLETLAEQVGLSAAHFHRQFRQLTGETPKQYCLRLRLERAAFRLCLYRDTVLDTALACGFRSHETFTRAFRRRFGVAPRDYRAERRERAGSTQVARGRLHPEVDISATRVEELDDLHVAFIRHIGPYKNVDPDLWRRLTEWGRAQGIEPPILMGIAHDAPGVTADDKLRFDAAIRVPSPGAPSGEIGFEVIPGGPYGVTGHVGPYATLERAYRLGFERLGALRRYRLVGLPALEIFHTTRISADYEMNRTDVCLPLQRA